MIKVLLATAFLASPLLAGASEEYVLHSFRKVQVTDKFWSEGAYFGDFNRDGQMDIVSGPFWYEGPAFVKRHEFYPATATFTRNDASGKEEVVQGFEGALGSKNAYSNNFVTYADDFNGDGWTDIFVIGMPGEECFWFENPKGGERHWTRYVAIAVTDNESPMFIDIVGDSKRELVCNSKGFFGYAVPDRSDPAKPWDFHPISPNNNYHKYNHGLGVGDVNGDGRKDLLEKDGWWEQPETLGSVWKHHAYPFAPNTGSSHMFAYDINGDGLNDVLTSRNPHGYGLAWFEQVKENGEITFKKHPILNERPDKDTKPAPNKYGLIFSQHHAIDLADINGDGLKDFVTGKRFWAHGPSGDDEPNAPAVLYWFQLARRENHGVEFIPHLIDDDSGVGTQVAAADVNGDRWLDIIVGNKKGTFVFLHQTRKVSQAEWEKAQPKPVAAGN
jgi:hypothetical protein